MRTILLLSAVATLAACSDDQPATAPRSTPAAVVPTPQAAVNEPAAAKGGQAAGGLNVTIVTSNEVWNQGYAVAGQAYCPAGTTRIGGGYQYINEGNPYAPMVVSQNYPIANGWWVRTLNAMPGGYAASFKVYVLCAS